MCLLPVQVGGGSISNFLPASRFSELINCKICINEFVNSVKAGPLPQEVLDNISQNSEICVLIIFMEHIQYHVSVSYELGSIPDLSLRHKVHTNHGTHSAYGYRSQFEADTSSSFTGEVKNAPLLLQIRS
ncbi:hypothetical protein L798_03395 [Zootermopsis nevadensis]|uniref:Uncharacterized protein n=1 Tax=Zootermopsis nevadensis TaxID=136037 RepID=A0A067RD24_ZOONE|nr:hypothetical protein L798_03395 [Zootermopsis nevadensis]